MTATTRLSQPVQVSLSLRGVTKSYLSRGRRTRVLDAVSLEVAPGEVVWLRGPSGSGKSSLLRIAGLLSTPDSGMVVVDGLPATTMRGAAARRDGVGMVFQNGNLLPDLSVRDNVAIAARRPVWGVVDRLLADFGLEEVAARLGKEVSGGQAQRAALCRAMLNDPRLVLADEPTAGLDPANRTVVLDELSRARRPDRAIVIASHDDEVVRVADRVLTIDRGRLV